MNNLIVFLLLCVGLTSAKRSQSTATIVMYREAEFMGRTAFEIKVNGQHLLNLPPKTHTIFTVPEGDLAIESYIFRGTKRMLKFSVKAGATYYIKTYAEIDFLDAYLRMMVVDELTAKAEMKKCTFRAVKQQ